MAWTSRLVARLRLRMEARRAEVDALRRELADQVRWNAATAAWIDEARHLVHGISVEEETPG